MQDDKQILKFICYTVEYIVHRLSALCVVHHLGHNLDYASEIVNMSTVSYELCPQNSTGSTVCCYCVVKLVLWNTRFLRYISCLLQGRQYYVQVSAYNMKGWGPAQLSQPPSAVPSSKFCKAATVAK